MFAKSKSSGSAPNVLLSNPLQNFYEIGKQSATAGPENAWRVYDAYAKADRKEVSIFFFDKRSVEKLYKPKRKETVTEILRNGARQMERFSHPKILQAYKVEECADSLAFVSEPVLASLANVLAYQEQRANSIGQSTSNVTKQTSSAASHHRTIFTKEYELLDIEIKYGLLQITEALLFLHVTRKVLHRNVCPASIIITKRGTWKLSGLEFSEKVNEMSILLQPWTNRMPKMAQPNLDYIAPEIQQKKMGGFYSDMYSFGMTICAIFNQGRPLIQANHSCSDYLKQLENLKEQLTVMLPMIPLPLQEAVSRLLHDDPEKRPTAQVLSMIKYFLDPAVHALQFLDVSKIKDVLQKEHFYTNTLKGILPYVPKKLWYQHIWTYLQIELESQEVQSAALQPVLYIVQNSTQDEYDQIVFPSLRSLFSSRKSVQGTVTLLENLHLILKKTSREYVETEVLPMLYASFENSVIQVQTASFIAVSNVTEYIDDEAIRSIVLPKLLQAFEKDSVDCRILINVIPCILNRLEKQKIVDCILPLLFNIELQEPEMIVRVVKIYRLMLSDKKYGLSVNWMATGAMPSLLPQTINPSLNLEQFELLFKVLQDMLNHIERYQRNQLTLDNLSLSSPERYRSLRHQHSTDNMHVPPFNIPNLRIEQRKTSSAEDMARKNSTNSISMTASAENMARKNSFAAVFGWFSSSNNDSNFLKVANTFTSRRLSDNTLMAPKIRVAPSCASSPGDTRGGGLPIRRHSSTGPQERRGSSINLSPPTGAGMPITSSSVPYLVSSSMNSIRGSRRPSVSSTSSQQGAGLLQQVGSSMVRQQPPICLNLNGPPPQPPTLSPLLQLPGQPSH
ncbi:SCY1-like protein bma isoform X1 [Osmia lignaria lignaria]|uniref:SCY1-like protein bma isoform X1 n=1 Tax=Osmia lignaria lignaria TaxID=1437193 RepID=UPI0014783C21|nr:SCY1-like protein 2 isoform X1 [Osmia lignaria]XP_034174810.1 SCY1-like protein 2 isoform X1 [Osmia lignaria]XP_034174819.1 SCY1-like protein 2 isoform X1 [Osmia lignaria]XP_034174823.1 SCY1-like protein 2 isoform X1 [Osmia lignaria]XP_034174831.1 SCY1-like protein 2 isoform X1 [Osmia lignaria]XP_034174837.1 SCY1-like protein 2 isoform X1 [Osmia lignaria]XP_034174842.1 SCY1-like protein 2 isoform X1 [Osmia lignaria]